MIGLVVHRYDTVESTNDVARELAEQGAAEGTVVVASEQTGGRGSRGRIWLSPPGVNLLISIILKPNLSIDRLGELVFMASAAVAGTVKNRLGLDAAIKWPNDVRVKGKKIAGMIIEKSKDSVVLGIGLNVNWIDIPKELSEKATSAAIELGAPVDLDSLLKAMLDDLDIAYGVYRAMGFKSTLNDWRKLAEPMGEQVIIRLGDGSAVQGKSVDVDEQGSLIVELSAGDRLTVSTASLVIF